MLKRQQNLKVNTWFQGSDDVISPAESISAISTAFLANCEVFKLDIVIDTKTFRKLMCEFVCTMYDCGKNNLDWKGPNRRFKLPDQWTDEIEGLWEDCLSMRFFNEHFWGTFWKGINESELFEIPYIRENLQYIMPLYVRRSTDILLEKGFLIEQDDGHVVATEDYESDEDTWDR